MSTIHETRNVRVGLKIGILIFVLNLLDGILTLCWTRKCGYSAEANPLMLLLMDGLGDWFLAPKVLVGLVTGVFCMLYWERFRSTRIAMKTVTYIYIGIIVYHLLCLPGLVYGANLNLNATWIPNTESNMWGYNLYRTDGARSKLNTTLIPHPPTLPYPFSVTVPDGSSGTLTFVLTAVNTSNNESLDSDVASYSYDLTEEIKTGPGGRGDTGPGGTIRLPGTP